MSLAFLWQDFQFHSNEIQLNLAIVLMADAVIVWASSYQSVKCREAKRCIDSLRCALWEVTLNDLNFAPQVLECATIDDKHISK